MKNDITIIKSLLSGEITCPASKSEAHRAIISACFCSERVKLCGVILNDDITATIEAMRVLGAGIILKGNELYITPVKNRSALIGCYKEIYCNESGSTLRFLIPITAALGINAVFHGKGKLPERPIDVYTDLLPQHGVKFHDVDKPHGEIMRISGKLRPGIFTIPGNISSQFITGLMFACTLMNGRSSVIITNEISSAGYINLTGNVLSKFGIDAPLHQNIIDINNFIYKNPKKYTIEGDYSSAAFFICAGAIAAGENGIIIRNLYKNTYQGDHKIIDIMKRMGARIDVSDDYIHVYKSELSGIDIDACDIPDLVPILCIAAVNAAGTTHIHNVKRLLYKESNRLEAMQINLMNMGADMIISDDCNTITLKKSALHGADINSYRDHRIVMSFCIAALISSGNVNINGAEAAAKSYPGFFDDYKKLGGIIK